MDFKKRVRSTGRNKEREYLSSEGVERISTAEGVESISNQCTDFRTNERRWKDTWRGGYGNLESRCWIERTER